MKIFLLDDYHRTAKKNYSKLLTKVCNGVYGHTSDFVDPPIIEDDFLLLVKTYRDNNDQIEAGNREYKNAYDTSKIKMTAGLDTVKAYVEDLPNLTVVLGNLSGYTVNKQSLSENVVPKTPVFKALVRLGGGTMVFCVDAVDNAEYYGAFLIEGSGLPEGSSFANGILEMPDGTKQRVFWHTLKQRVKAFYNLTTGKEYTIFYFAGNTAGVSYLSDGKTFTASDI